MVSASEGYVFHNGLTHTLEVAQIARRLAEKLLRDSDRALVERLGGIHPEVVEAAAHDLGHPPFGHVAEKQLDSLARDHNASDGFEGNAQSFRFHWELERLPGGDEQRPHPLETRLAVDIVSSFTDSQAVIMYRRLLGAEPGSVVELLHR